MFTIKTVTRLIMPRETLNCLNMLITFGQPTCRILNVAVSGIKGAVSAKGFYLLPGTLFTIMFLVDPLPLCLNASCVEPLNRAYLGQGGRSYDY
jgi:hypothetical protein